MRALKFNIGRQYISARIHLLLFHDAGNDERATFSLWNFHQPPFPRRPYFTLYHSFEIHAKRKGFSFLFPSSLNYTLVRVTRSERCRYSNSWSVLNEFHREASETSFEYSLTALFMRRVRNEASRMDSLLERRVLSLIIVNCIFLDIPVRSCCATSARRRTTTYWRTFMRRCIITAVRCYCQQIWIRAWRVHDLLRHFSWCIEWSLKDINDHWMIWNKNNIYEHMLL